MPDSLPEGGETPILDCREAYKQLDPDLRETFLQRTHVCPQFVKGMDVNWQEFFHTADRAVVQKCANARDVVRMDEGGRPVRPSADRAVAKHPVSNEITFFNQVQLHHPRALDPETRASLLSILGESGLPRNVFYGDGTRINDEVIDRIGSLYRKLAVSFSWQKGDLLALDNMLVSHARNPYRGPRKIVVAMGEMIRSDELSD